MLRKLLRRLGWLAYAGAVLGASVVVAYLAFSLFVRRGVTTVPEVAGLLEAEATAQLLDQGLALRVDDTAARYDEAAEAGLVLQQSPGPGSLVKRGSSIDVVISLGPELVEVPDLRGRALPAALVTLNAAGLVVGRTAGVYSSTGLPGTVAEQNPQPGLLVGRATQVELFLCLEARGETYLMPDLIYRDFARVRGYFSSRGLRLGSVKFEEYEGIAPGVILRQFPLPGHPLRQREVISLVVAADNPAGA